jgi:toxin-antitoxin system PIN domain toxin
VGGHPLHTTAKTWLAKQESAASIAFCRATQQGFLRLITTSAVMAGHGAKPLNNSSAWAIFEKLSKDERITFAEEPGVLGETWKKFAARSNPSPKLWMDAYLAAFAVRAGFQLVTADKAFTQFDGLDLCLLEA